MKKRRRRNLGIFIAFLVCSLSYAQASKSDQLLSSILAEVRAVNKERAFFLVDSIYKNDADVHVKIHALFIHAYLYHDEFDIPTSLQFAFQAIDLAEKNKSYKWLSRLYGFVGAEYSRLGLFSEAQVYFDKIEAVLPYVKDEHDQNFSYFYYYHLLSAFYYEQKQYNEALLSIQRAESYISKISDVLLHLNHYMGSVEQNKGINYLELKQYDKAEKAYEKGLAYILKEENMENFLALGYIYVGLAKIKVVQGKLNDADQILDYYQKGLHIATVNDNRDLKEIAYDALRAYYEALGQWENYSKYNKAFLDERREKEEFRTKTVNELLEKQQSYKDEINSKNKKYLVIIVSFLVLLLLAPGVYFLVRRKKISKEKQDDKSPTALLQKLAQAKESELGLFFSGVHWSTDAVEAEEKKAVEALLCFEEQKGFLDGSCTLESVAADYQLATSELIAVLRKYKQMDFKVYLVQWRLYESVKLLRFSPDFRDYKISHLAEVVGFSSHSSYSVEFKRSIGVSPSFFIQYLEEIEKK